MRGTSVSVAPGAVTEATWKSTAPNTDLMQVQRHACISLNPVPCRRWDVAHPAWRSGRGDVDSQRGDSARYAEAVREVINTSIDRIASADGEREAVLDRLRLPQALGVSALRVFQFLLLSRAGPMEQ